MCNADLAYLLVSRCSFFCEKKFGVTALNHDFFTDFSREHKGLIDCTKTEVSLKLTPAITCSIPGLEELIENSTSLKECPDLESGKRTFYNLTAIANDFTENGLLFKCRNPCRQTFYSSSVQVCFVINGYNYYKCYKPLKHII